MPVVIKSASTTTNRAVSFNFDTDVLAFVVGISHWKFVFGGSDDHHVKNLELSVQTNKPFSRQVTSYATARLQDDSGHNIDNTRSSVNLVCIAQTTSADSGISLSTVESVTPPGLSRDGLVPSSSGLDICAAFLEGFRASYTGNDHHVKQLQSGVGLVPAGGIAQLSSFVQISDGSGNVGSGSVDAGVVATTPEYSGLLGQAVLDMQTSTAHTVTFRRPIVAGAALLQSYLVAFSGDDHHVREIGGGVPGWSIQNGSLVLSSARAFMTDGSGHRQSDSMSRVSVIAFGVPA